MHREMRVDNTATHGEYRSGRALLSGCVLRHWLPTFPATASYWQYTVLSVFLSVAQDSCHVRRLAGRCSLPQLVMVMVSCVVMTHKRQEERRFGAKHECVDSDRGTARSM